MEKPDFGHFSIFKPPKHTVKIILAKNEYQIRNPLIFLHILGTHVVVGEQKFFLALYGVFKILMPRWGGNGRIFSKFFFNPYL